MSVRDGLRDHARAAFTENRGLKILSLFCSLALYGLVHGTENAQRTFPVSVISLMPEAPGRVLLTPPPNEVYVTLRGSRSQLDDLHAADLGSLRLDLTSGHESTIELTPEMLHVPTGLAVEQIVPSTIKVAWDDLVTRTAPVQVARTGEPAKGFMVKGGITVDPPEVTVKGPRSLVEGLTFVRAAPFDVSGLTEGTFRHPLPVDKPPSMVTFAPSEVFATVEIARELVKKHFPRLKVEVIGAPRATTAPTWVTVVVTGTPEEVNAISPEGIVPRVEPKGAGDDTSKPGSDVLPVIVDLPRVKVEIDPPKVVVKW